MRLVSTIVAGLFALLLPAGGALAANDAAAPLPPGKPAGVRQAQTEGKPAPVSLGASVLLGGIAILSGGSQPAPRTP